jgi:predicted O-methyltransferase YrrM
MDDTIFASVDAYLEGLLAPGDEALDRALRTAAAAGLPPIQVPALQGKFLQLLVGICGARRVLEVGTLGGYSTIHLARGLPDDGQVVTVEIDPGHARVALQNFDAAGLGDRVRVIVGQALDSLAELAKDQSAPFDLVFIDADKVNNASYLSWAITLGRPGTVIVVDNVVRRGAVVDAANTDAAVVGTRTVLELMASDDRLDATALQTVGAKGYDGFALAVVR